MVRCIGAQVGLLAFAVAILAGLHAGNAASTVLLRAIVVMFAAAVIGQLVAWISKLILRDHLQRRKLEIDRQHQASLKPESPVESAAPSAPVRAG